jgi:uncharacterized tellurite resistance protein B-like protein
LKEVLFLDKDSAQLEKIFNLYISSPNRMDQLQHLSKKGKSYIKHLLQVAMADGHLDAVELRNLLQKAKKFDFSEEEVMEIRKNLDHVKPNPPSGTKEKFQLIFDLVWMMMIDGTVYEKEKRICENLAMQMGFSPETIDDLIGVIRNDVAKGISSEETYKKLERMFK